MKQKKTVWLAVAFVVVVVGFVVLTTFQGKRVSCRVCIAFKGQRDCRTASAANKMEAQRTATTNACAQLSSGVTESGQCENTLPESVEWLP
jgi:hypothetical protein